MALEDKELVEQYRKGDVDALASLVEKYRRPLFGFILGMTEGRGDEDEIFQEAWFKAIRKIKSYRHGNFFGWLVRIARNTVIDAARKKRPDLSLDREKLDGVTVLDGVAGSEPTPTWDVADAELGGRIREAVATLPDEQREVFVMRMQSGVPFKEIARIQKVSINTALARMQYALNKLRPLLQEDYGELTGAPREER